MVTKYNPAGGKTYTLGASIGSTDTTITLSSFLLPVSGIAITMAILNSDIAYGTIAPKTTSSEFISFTGITQNANGTATLTGVTRGLDRVSPFTASATYRLPHSGQSVFILSDAPQVFSEYAALKNANTFLNLNIFSGVAPQTDTDPVAGNDLTRLSYVQALVLGTLTTINVIVPGKAGATITAGQMVYFDDPTNRWLLTDATNPLKSNNVLLGVAQGAGTVGNAITNGVLLQGVDSHQSGLTEGQAYYLSNTPGAISTSAGTNSVIIGLGSTTATTLYFAPRFNQQLTQNQIDALAGTSGTPSSTNKYVTNDDTATAATASKLARRTATGDVTVSLIPIQTTDAASKSYVDGKFSGLAFGQTLNEQISATTTIATFGTDAGGTSLIMVTRDTGATSSFTMIRFLRDASTGQWYDSGDSGSTATTGITQAALFGVTFIGSFVYVTVTTNTPLTYVYRYSATNIAGGGTNLTISGTGPSSGAGGHISYTDGTDLYIYSTGTTWYRYTISGTTITNAATLTGPSSPVGAIYDGTNLYVYSGTIIGRYAFTLGSVLASLTSFQPQNPISLLNASTTALHVVSRSSGGASYFYPITKP